MNHFFTLIKMNIKLLLRNKVFLFFLCVTPVLSVLILNLNTTSTEEKKEEGNSVIELEEPSKRAVYVADTTKYIVKVYDAAGSLLSEYVLKKMADMGMFAVCRCKVEDMTDQEALIQAEQDAYEDRAGVILYLNENFDREIIEGNWDRAIRIYHVSEDERFGIFEESLEEQFSIIRQLAVKTGGSSEGIAEELSRLSDIMPDKKVVTVSGKEETALDSRFEGARDRIGYSFAFVTLGFLFCGVCVSYTVIEEQENKVYTRIMLTKAGKYEYLLTKLMVSLAIALLQTGVLAICMLLFGNLKVEISIAGYLFMIFLLGVIFNVLSLNVGVLMGDVMGANYAVFVIWSVSALLSGLYFSLDSSNAVIKTISYLMPQKWFLKGTEMLMAGDKSAYSMLICITAAYLIVILSAGVAGLRIQRND